ncbi:cytochrome P450 [Archangium violaceum]|uniref:cytochrome P450 n=1 Tax=Archangium violaceum TaxID=83451 RepID=UPI0037C1958D
MEDLELRGRRILCKGKLVFLRLAAANQEPDIFTTPNRFDITCRKNKYLAFAFGPHLSLGAGLAHLELELALRTLLCRMPDLRLDEQRPPRFPQAGEEGESVAPEAALSKEPKKERMPRVDSREAAAQDVRVGRVRLRQVWRLAEGAGVSDSSRWGACHPSSPAHRRAKVMAPGARAPWRGGSTLARPPSHQVRGRSLGASLAAAPRAA